MYGSETLFYTLKKGQAILMIGNRVLRKRFGSKNDKEKLEEEGEIYVTRYFVYVLFFSSD